MSYMNADEIHAFNHGLIVGRIRDLLETSETGKRLAIKRDLLAYSLLGHQRHWPSCPAQIQPLSGRLF